MHIDGRIDLCLGDVARQVDDDIGGGETREAFRRSLLLLAAQEEGSQAEN
jgi:hypothetical protein